MATLIIVIVVMLPQNYVQQTQPDTFIVVASRGSLIIYQPGRETRTKDWNSSWTDCFTVTTPTDPLDFWDLVGSVELKEVEGFTIVQCSGPLDAFCGIIYI